MKKYLNICYQAADEAPHGHSTMTLKETVLGAYHSVFRLFYSLKDRGWTEQCRGKLAAKLEDTGNYYAITVSKKRIDLDYAEAEYVLLLLQEAGNKSRFKRIVEETVVA
jgi:hypothetical protein